MITQLVDIELFAADTAAQCRDQRADFLGREHLVKTGFLDVEDLALEWQDSLGLAVTALFSRATRRVTLHYVEFREGRVFLLAIRQLAGQTGDIQCPFAAGHFTCLAGSFSGTRGINHLADDRLGFTGFFQQIIGKALVHFLFDCRLHFGRHQFVLGLRGELWIRHLD